MNPRYQMTHWQDRIPSGPFSGFADIFKDIMKDIRDLQERVKALEEK